jgi:1-deoxy-D-xylulose-5-phosphate reductoisomerase
MIKKKKVIILGSTGSIGESALDIVRRNSDKFEVLGLSAHTNKDALRKQTEEFKVQHTVLASSEKGLCDLASMESDILVVGISGLAALKPIVASLGRTKRIVLANKEAVLCAGNLLMDLVENSPTELYPVDSEAWGVYRLLSAFPGEEIKKVCITASGGPFFFKDRNCMDDASIEEVLNHPVWDMGKRITVDSATFMNKGFEVIEIHRLFGISLEKIEVVVHPQSAVHAYVEMNDGTVFSSMFNADMRIPIGYGMCSINVRRYDLSNVSSPKRSTFKKSKASDATSVVITPSLLTCA